MSSPADSSTPEPTSDEPTSQPTSPVSPRAARLNLGPNGEVDDRERARAQRVVGRINPGANDAPPMQQDDLARAERINLGPNSAVPPGELAREAEIDRRITPGPAADSTH